MRTGYNVSPCTPLRDLRSDRSQPECDQLPLRNRSDRSIACVQSPWISPNLVNNRGNPRGERGRRGTVSGPPDAGTRAGVAGDVGLRPQSVLETAVRGRHHANRAYVDFGAPGLLPACPNGTPGTGAARWAERGARLPGRPLLQLRAWRRLPRMPVVLYLPRVPLRGVALFRRRLAASVPAHALHLGRLGPRRR